MTRRPGFSGDVCRSPCPRVTIPVRGCRMNPQVGAKTIAITEFVSELRKFSASSFERQDPILSFLRDSPVAPDTLERYLTWDAQHYTRNLIDKTPLYELIAICWDIGHISSIHNHRDQNCWMAAPIGRLQVPNHLLPNQDLEKGQCKPEKRELLDLNAQHPRPVYPKEPVHKGSKCRDSNERASSVQVYSQPY